MNKNVKKLFIMIIVCLMSIMMLSTTSNAASFKATISETTVEVGDTLTVTIKLDNAAGMYDVSVSDTSVLEVTSGATSEFLDNESATIKFKAKKAGTATITATPTDVVDNDNSEKQITEGKETFKVKVIEIPKEEEKSETTNTDKEKEDTTNKEDKKEDTTNKEDKKEDKKETTTTKSKDATIKNLTAQTSSQNLSVKKSSNKYTTTVAADVNKVTFTVTTSSNKATIDSNQTTSGTKLSLNSSSNGKKVYTLSDLKEGGNSVVKITIKAENGNTENYNFVITRKVAEKTDEVIPNVIDEKEEDKADDKKEDEEDDDKEDDKEKTTLGLKSLVLTGVELSPSFSEDVFEYTAEIVSSSSVEIIAVPTVEDATIEVVGNKDMVEGENIISILVKSKDGSDVKTYQVIVDKKNEAVEAVAGVSDEEDEEKKEGLNLSTEQIIIIVVAVIIGIGVIIALIIMAKKRDEDDYYDFSEDKSSQKKGKRAK